jgi:hypothetical protein
MLMESSSNPVPEGALVNGQRRRIAAPSPGFSDLQLGLSRVAHLK